MKFAWPESQKRVSLKWGNIDSVASSAGGSGGVATVGVAWAFCVAAADGDAGCCALTGATEATIKKIASANFSGLEMSFNPCSQRTRVPRYLFNYTALKVINYS